MDEDSRGFFRLVYFSRILGARFRDRFQAGQRVRARAQINCSFGWHAPNAKNRVERDRAASCDQLGRSSGHPRVLWSGYYPSERILRRSCGGREGEGMGEGTKAQRNARVFVPFERHKLGPLTWAERAHADSLYRTLLGEHKGAFLGLLLFSFRHESSVCICRIIRTETANG